MTDMVEILREQGRHDIADEIERLRAEIERLLDQAADIARQDLLDVTPQYVELVNVQLENERLRTRILELEATVATLRGSMAEPDPAPVGFGVTYDIPPSTPR